MAFEIQRGDNSRKIREGAFQTRNRNSERGRASLRIGKE